MAISNTAVFILFAPINMVHFRFSMLSNIFPYWTTVLEIPTGLKALGMTKFWKSVPQNLLPLIL